MSQSYEQQPETIIVKSGISRVIPCKKLEYGDPIKWLMLGFNDVLKAPFITVFYGAFFAVIPWLILNLVMETGWHLVAIPSIVCFMMLGPFLAAGLYDVSWEIEKGHNPTLMHSFRATKRNAVNEWGFGVLLLVTMIFWLRISALIHALYPAYLDPNDLASLAPFLIVGTAIGAVLSLLVFSISVFTQPILMERKVDLATAVLTSINAVILNFGVLVFWGLIIFACVLIGYVTSFVAFVILMPMIGYGTWHAYIDAIETKRERKYQ